MLLSFAQFEREVTSERIRDKRRARLNLIRHLLDSIPYKKVDVELPKIPKAQRRPKDATEGLSAGLLIPGKY